MKCSAVHKSADNVDNAENFNQCMFIYFFGKILFKGIILMLMTLTFMQLPLPILSNIKRRNWKFSSLCNNKLSWLWCYTFINWVALLYFYQRAANNTHQKWNYNFISCFYAKSALGMNSGHKEHDKIASISVAVVSKMQWNKSF